MQIYVIEPGDTVFEIARDFDVPEGLLIDSNEIEDPEHLVVGQTLVIPIWGSYYFVDVGDTLESISAETGVSVEQIIRLNALEDPGFLDVGTRLYLPQVPREVIDVAAYVDLNITGPRTVEEIDNVGEHLTYLNIFSYEMNPDGTLRQINDEEAIQAALANDVYPIMVITNLEDGQFSQDLATTVLQSDELQNVLLQETLAIMEARGYAGVDFDLEYLGEINREQYNEFLRRAVELFNPLGYSVSTALAPKYYPDQPGILYEGHDYEAQGQIVDYIYFMTYEWGWSGGPPRPVAPINEVRRVIEYAASVVPNDKIMMGIPLYGYDWTLPYEPGGPFARSLSPQRALEIAREYGVEIEYDEDAQAPFFTYIDEDGNSHIVWFEDARSIQAKFDLVKELGLRGFYYWVLGRDFPQNWLLIEDNFIVRKKV
ncbi:spore germination protein [Natranaerovirga pectinivora]|uniref:Spore germination protein n=1 Tax=Natranaerovirga pectinivora TaxID=682400 RepID=A0A4R3MMU8_9FIRM|nr:glycoside hydrolase family 18 protein [Natranaerovirga pectinivora]TCT16309.1 spore germination protein [Natranaerovirga pectinivora]